MKKIARLDVRTNNGIKGINCNDNIANNNYDNRKIEIIKKY